MDARRFDRWAQSLPQPRTRRGLLGVLAGVPVVGSLSALLVDPEGAAARKKKKKKKSGKKCQPQNTATTCKGRCGTVTNNCGKAVACQACNCQQDPSVCAAGEDCCVNGCADLQTDRRHCGACGTACPDGQVCQGGVCGVACGGDACPTATEICDANACRPCDVCPTCTHTTVQAAIDAANTGATVRICAGSYSRPSENRSLASISRKNLTLVGAGTGDGGTILDGGRIFSIHDVFKIEFSASILRNLTVTGGLGGAGILVDDSANLTLSGALVTQNWAIGDGGGVHVVGAVLILDAGTIITGNEASRNGGGIYNQFDGIITINEGARVTGNHVGNVGGGIWNERGTIIINGGVVDGNAADVNGKDIYNDDIVEFRRGTVGECFNAGFGRGCP